MASLKVYIVRRVLLAIPMIFILLSIVFLIMRVAGDPVSAILGGHAPQEQIEQIKQQLGLNKPIIFQFFGYIGQLLRGNLGRSLIWGQRPVVNEIWDHFPATLELSISSFLISIIIGIFTGTVAATHRNRFLDHTFRLYGIITYGLFIPWIGIMLQLLFGVYLGLLPIGGRIGTLMEPKSITGLYVLDSLLTLNFDSLVSAIKHLILPSVTLGVYLSGIYTRLTRTHLMETLEKDFIKAARARGLSERAVIYKHGLKNAFIPILTMMGLQFALLLVGAVLTEITFSWPGMGTLLFERITYRDFTTVQGIIVFFALIVVTVNLLVDIIYAYIDPRIRY
ncbi:MAG TPA: ABC transporter permease [Candidatus Aerophobetes bacterium]|uniref:ABC transporter permease n=1 Tax=Aerophobetes bacterium TaxID=2030807 RepID=A0A662DLG6_UNCAE|nr:MAG: ABC transporter permease [Candidatus Aerophobetes bacterium]HDN84708.1 ABC transporter permease [Candidatus Aerophobetes bacterium]